MDFNLFMHYLSTILFLSKFLIIRAWNDRQPGIIANPTFKGVVPYKITLDQDHPREYISSPGFPHEDYLSNIQIIYEIEMKAPNEIAQMSNRILLTFEFFCLEESPFCNNDGLEIVDSSGQFRVYCGVQVGRTILTESSKLRIRFFTNSHIASRGYSILMEMYNTECSQLFKGVNAGTFASPNFPGRYHADNLCVWKIEAPEGKAIRVKFDDIFDIRSKEPLCTQDYLAVSLTGDFKTHIKSYCHGEKPLTMESFQSSMLFKFHSDCCFEGKGFSASFVVIDKDDITTTPPFAPKPQICTIMKKDKGVDVYYCGGALISRQYVLTAAHCLLNETASAFRIVLGAHDSDSDPEPVPISHIITHPEYIRNVSLNDIALLKLKNLATLSDQVRVICLPTARNFVSPGDMATVAGWGWEKPQGGTRRKQLHEVDVPILSHPDCVSKYPSAITETNICAGGVKGKDSCNGDSGGSLFVKYDDKWFSVGISSWGMSCGKEGYPGIYTRVSEYLDWIAEEIKDSPPCDDHQEEIPPPVQPNLENCGIPKNSDEQRTAGGIEAEPLEFPWMAMIVYNRNVVGAGALISPYYVLTVASIFDNWVERYPNIVEVFLGKHRVPAREPSSIRFDVQAVYCHKGYGNPTPYNNDLALLKLLQPAGDQYRPICLPRMDALYPPSKTLTTAGWGRTSERGQISNVLLKANLDVKSKEDCQQRYPGWFTRRMICAYKRGTDTCEGDTNGPLMINSNGRYYIAGVSSWGTKDGCVTVGAPRVFSAIHSNLEWISSITGLNVA